MIRRGAILLLAALALAGGPAEARFDPQIIGEAAHPQCRQALAMARQAFRSTSASLLWPIVAPEGSRITLAPNVEELSGGDALTADPSVFDRIESDPLVYSFVIYWQREPSFGKRIAVVDRARGWRGDWFTVHLLAPTVTVDRLSKQVLDEASSGTTWGLFEPVLGDNRWLPPLFLKDGSSGMDWFIDRGNSWDVQADWAVYTIGDEGLNSACRVRFASPKGLQRLPPAVRRLAALLDEALGPGNDEGTLQPTARIRGDVEDGWANAGSRPWALTDRPYNTRAEVERGLAEWTRHVPARKRVYRAIQRAYPEAERGLARYYVQNFGLSAEVARTFSRYAVDHMLRAYFVFPAGGFRYPGVEATVWPENVR